MNFDQFAMKNIANGCDSQGQYGIPLDRQQTTLMSAECN